MPGQVKIRIRYRKYCSSWFDYLLVSKPEMREIVDNTGWRIGHFISTRNQKSSSRGQPYVAILERDN